MQKCRIIRSATRGRSVGFFPLKFQVSRSSSYTGRATYIVFPLGTDHTFDKHRIVGVRSRTVPQAVTVRSIPPGTHPCRSVFICVDSQGQGKTRRFASVLQCRAFTNWTNWSTWHVASYVEAIGLLPGACVHWRQLGAFTARTLNSTELTDLSPWLACIYKPLGQDGKLPKTYYN